MLTFGTKPKTFKHRRMKVLTKKSQTTAIPDKCDRCGEETGVRFKAMGSEKMLCRKCAFGEESVSQPDPELGEKNKDEQSIGHS